MNRTHICKLILALILGCIIAFLGTSSSSIFYTISNSKLILFLFIALISIRKSQNKLKTIITLLILFATIIALKIFFNTIRIKNEINQQEVLLRECEAKKFEKCQDLAYSHLKLLDLENSKKYYKIACDNGIEKACVSYISIFSKNDEERKKLFKERCESKSGKSCYSLSNIYRKEKNDIQADKFLEKACGFKDSYSCQVLAQEAKKTDLWKAFGYYQKACESDSLYCGHLTGICRTSISTNFKESGKLNNNTLEKCEKLCMTGDDKVCGLLADHFEKKEHNIVLAFKYFTQVCNYKEIPKDEYSIKMKGCHDLEYSCGNVSFGDAFEAGTSQEKLNEASIVCGELCDFGSEVACGGVSSYFYDVKDYPNFYTYSYKDCLLDEKSCVWLKKTYCTKKRFEHLRNTPKSRHKIIEEVCKKVLTEEEYENSFMYENYIFSKSKTPTKSISLKEFKSSDKYKRTQKIFTAGDTKEKIAEALGEKIRYWKNEKVGIVKWKFKDTSVLKLEIKNSKVYTKTFYREPYQNIPTDDTLAKKYSDKIKIYSKYEKILELLDNKQPSEEEIVTQKLYLWKLTEDTVIVSYERNSKIQSSREISTKLDMLEILEN